MRIAPFTSFSFKHTFPRLACPQQHLVFQAPPKLPQKSLLIGSGRTFLSLAYLFLSTRPQARVVCLDHNDFSQLSLNGFRARIMQELPKLNNTTPIFLCFEGTVHLLHFLDENTFPDDTLVFGWNTGRSAADHRVINTLFREKQIKPIQVGNMLTHFENTLAPNRNAFHLLHRFLEKFEGPQKGVILLEPDPDSIASALAIREILKAKHQDITLFATFKPSRPENRELLRYLQRNLNFRIAYANGIDFFAENKFDYALVVDANPSNEKVFRFFPEGTELRAAFDHHPLGRPINFSGEFPNTFFDIRTQYGACASMLTEYLRAQGHDFSKLRSLATALYYGIITDTQGLKAARFLRADRESLQFLSEFIDRPMLDTIQNKKIQFSHRHFLAEAFGHLREVPGHEDFIYTFLGDIGNQHEILATIAEQILSFFGKSYIAVAALHGEGTERVLDISTRGIDKKFKWNMFLRRHHAGFGHADMARGAKPLQEIPALSHDDISTADVMAYLQELFGKIT